MNPDVGTKDRYVVQEVIKDMAKSRSIDAAGKQGFKVLALNEVDKLSKGSEHGLTARWRSTARRALDSHLQPAPKSWTCSRCLPIRVAAPSDGPEAP